MPTLAQKNMEDAKSYIKEQIFNAIVSSKKLNDAYRHNDNFKAFINQYCDAIRMHPNVLKVVGLMEVQTDFDHIADLLITLSRTIKMNSEFEEN